VNDLDEGDDLPHGEVRALQILDDPPLDALRHSARLRADPAFARLIQGRDVGAGDLASGAAEDLAAGRALHLGDELRELDHPLLALAHAEQVEEVGRGLRVEGDGPAAHDERIVVASLGREQGHPRELQAFKDVRQAELVLQREADYVELPHRPARLDREERHPRFAHRGRHVGPRREGALGSEAVAPV